MKKICFVFLSIVLLLAMTACNALKAQNFSYPDSSSQADSFISFWTSLANEKSLEFSSSTGGNSIALSQASSSPSSAHPASGSSSTAPIVSPSATPTPVVIAEKAIVFDDPLCEKLLRDYIKKPSGTCFTSDFSSLSGIYDIISIDYSIYNNQTTFSNQYPNSPPSSKVTGMPASFAALSKIPVRNLYLNCLTPIDRDDIFLTFDISGIASSGELLIFGFTGLDDVAARSRLIQHMTFTNFESFSLCTKLKELYLWDCKGVKLDSISNIQNLEGLSLNNNNITNIAAIKNMSKLRFLQIFNNNVTDFTPLINHPALKDIGLMKISTPIDVETLLTIPLLKYLTLSDCIPLTRAEREKLYQRGIEVNEYPN